METAEAVTAVAAVVVAACGVTGLIIARKGIRFFCHHHKIPDKDMCMDDLCWRFKKKRRK